MLDLQVGKVAEASQQAEEGEEAVSIVTVMQVLLHLFSNRAAAGTELASLAFPASDILPVFLVLRTITGNTHREGTLLR